MTLRGSFLLILAAAAAFNDIMTGKISNLICAAGLAAGAWLAFYPGGQGVREFAAGAAVPAVLGYGLFRLRMTGAGDVKLLTAAGGMTGISGLLNFAFASLLMGGALSLMIIIFCTGVRERAAVMKRYACAFIESRGSGKLPSYRQISEEMSGTAAEFHFAVPVFMAALLYAGGLL
ncbi:MAG: prepilin peptidase [Lachnospiraceae bacterium]|nr:prepilin peptidase [Lachnospiraceae bacterium]